MTDPRLTEGTQASANHEPSADEPPLDSELYRFFGGMLTAIGVLLVVICGLCSLAYVAGSINNPGSPYSAQGLVLLKSVAVVGGIPIAVGVFAVITGRLLCRRGGRRP
jgi:hypothetical protein